ncbi:DUF732 domain-containing protein [Actinocatenispora rupis]|uniref:DUF732 domain-containing protein n=1 Tax=Actinocatenispora rupis TaxID=519421 RepID=UPI0019410BE6|nr:DUF732 domain-containing protein [Actinocatenispora rupis]
MDTAQTVMPGSRQAVLAVGKSVCTQLRTTTITPIAQQITRRHHVRGGNGEYVVNATIRFVCPPLDRTDADRAYLTAADHLDIQLTARPELALYRGRDICYLIDHSNADGAVTITQRREPTSHTTAGKLVAIAHQTLCPS